MRKIFPISCFAALAILSGLPGIAHAEAGEDRMVGGAMGAVAGVIVAGPIGLIAGAAIGYAAAPVFAPHERLAAPVRRVTRRVRRPSYARTAAPAVIQQSYQESYLRPQADAQMAMPSQAPMTPQTQQAYTQPVAAPGIAYAQAAPLQPGTQTAAAPPVQRPAVYPRVPSPFESARPSHYSPVGYQPQQ